MKELVKTLAQQLESLKDNNTFEVLRDWKIFYDSLRGICAELYIQDRLVIEEGEVWYDEILLPISKQQVI